jgi:hypothetical protein
MNCNWQCLREREMKHINRENKGKGKEGEVVLVLN